MALPSVFYDAVDASGTYEGRHGVIRTYKNSPGDSAFIPDGSCLWVHNPDRSKFIPDQKESSTVTDPNPNRAKLTLAAEHSLQAKFLYQGEDDTQPRERRVIADDSFVDSSGNFLVGGESFDEDGDGEGYRQFRLDRITSKVVVR